MPGTLTAGEALCRTFWTNYRLKNEAMTKGINL